MASGRTVGWSTEQSFLLFTPERFKLEHLNNDRSSTDRNTELMTFESRETLSQDIADKLARLSAILSTHRKLHYQVHHYSAVHSVTTHHDMDTQSRCEWSERCERHPINGTNCIGDTAPCICPKPSLHWEDLHGQTYIQAVVNGRNVIELKLEPLFCDRTINAETYFLMLKENKISRQIQQHSSDRKKTFSMTWHFSIGRQVSPFTFRTNATSFPIGHRTLWTCQSLKLGGHFESDDMGDGFKTKVERNHDWRMTCIRPAYGRSIDPLKTRRRHLCFNESGKFIDPRYTASQRSTILQLLIHRCWPFVPLTFSRGRFRESHWDKNWLFWEFWKNDSNKALFNHRTWQ